MGKEHQGPPGSMVREGFLDAAVVPGAEGEDPGLLAAQAAGQRAEGPDPGTVPPDRGATGSQIVAAFPEGGPDFRGAGHAGLPAYVGIRIYVQNIKNPVPEPYVYSRIITAAQHGIGFFGGAPERTVFFFESSAGSLSFIFL